MFEKHLLHRMLTAVVQNGGLRVAYWDGDTQTYGANPDITVHLRTPAAAWAIITRGSIGVGEAYMDHGLEVEGPLDRLVKVSADNLARQNLLELGSRLRPNHTNTHSKQRFQIQHHYDIGNEFYRLWLDDSMTYSCAYYQNESDTLEQAQDQKRRHILNKLRLSEDMELLDIGSGWGQLLLTAAREYRVRCLGITLSKEQYELSTRRAQAQGLDHLVRFEMINFQDLAKTASMFDRIVSVGMFEHVGRTNQHLYFDAVKKMLRPEGLSVLHTISGSYEAPVNAWIDRYIFPGGYIPSYQQVVTEVARHDFEFLDYEDLRMHYAKTLDEWLRRFDANVETIEKRYGERFVRMWRFYLATSAGSFRWRRLNLSQIVFAGPRYVAPLTRDYMYPASLNKVRTKPSIDASSRFYG